MAKDAGHLVGVLRWAGMALVVAGALMVVATVLHPSRETAATIATESRLVAAHVGYTLAWLLVLLGLPGLYAAQRGRMGRLGLVGFLTAFLGTYLIAVTGTSVSSPRSWPRSHRPCSTPSTSTPRSWRSMGWLQSRSWSDLPSSGLP